MAVTEAQARATAKWERKTYDKVLLRIRNDGTVTRDMISQAAEACGESLNEYVLKAIKMRMDSPE